MYASIASGRSTAWVCAGMSTHAARAPLARLSLRSARVRRMRAQLVQLKQEAGAEAQGLSGAAEL
jgi:hypothetical protein